MAATNEDQRGPSGDSDSDSQPPAGLSFGRRRQPISRDMPTGARRGQVKGLFGVATPSLPASPVVEAAAGPPAWTHDAHSQAQPAVQTEIADPLDSFFGADHTMAASALLESLRAEARGLDAEPLARKSPSHAAAQLRVESASDLRAPDDSGLAQQTRSGLRGDEEPKARSGTRHKRVEPDAPIGVEFANQALDEAPAATEALVPKTASSPPKRRPSARPPAQATPVAGAVPDWEPPVHSPRFLVTGSILAGALVLGGAFMAWSLRSSEPPAPKPAVQALGPGALTGSENDIVTWSPQAEHSHAPELAARPPAPAASPQPTTAADPPSAATSPAPTAPAQMANPAANPSHATTPASPQPAIDPAAATPAARVEPVRKVDSPRELAAARAETVRAVAALVANARAKLAEDDSVAAEQLCRKALNADPQNQQASELLAHALIDQDRGREALPLARRLVQRNSQRLSYRLLLGDVLLMTGDDSGAKSEWQHALELAPEDAETKRRLGL